MRLCVVVPLLNEEANLPELHRRLRATLDKIGGDHHIILVDDGSTDSSTKLIAELSQADATVVGLRLSRNFGHEAASTAGLDLAAQLGAEAAILMDADLQDPPEMIEQLVARWKEGYEIVYALRRRREGESLGKRLFAWLFYRLLNGMSDVRIPMDAGDFRLMDAKVLRALGQCREKDRFMRALVAWTGFKSMALPYDRPPRQAGRTHYRFWKLLLLSLDAAVGFSITPLRLASALGFVITLLSMVLAGIIVVQKMMGRMPAPGYALMASGLFFLGGVQMLLLGILGEYIGRIYRQTQGRPLYLVSQKIPTGDLIGSLTPAAPTAGSAGAAPKS